jgi:hypothetical protein
MERQRIQRRKRRSSIGVVIRRLDPSDPRSLDHACHKEQWLALVDAIASMAARKAFEKESNRKPRRQAVQFEFDF